MNLFSCCKQVQSGSGYQVRSNKNKKTPQFKFFRQASDIPTNLLNSQQSSILKINKSDYETIAKEYNKKDKKWTDFSFPPNDQSLGILKNITSNKWRRISQIIPNPVIFKSPMIPSDVIQSQFGDKAFLASVASLTEKPERISDLFGNQTFNPNGFYKILLRVKSEIQEILIDDYVPVNEDGFPLFSKPNENQVWVMLLQKARAKVYGSYANMLDSKHTPKQIFQQIDFAPTQRLNVPQANNEGQVNKVWRIIYDNSQRNRPIVLKTGLKSQINWNVLNLSADNYYSLIDSASLKNSLGKQQRIVKLRNASGKNQWKGTAHQNDKVFWDQIQQNEAKQKFLAPNEHGNDGIFYMLYSDLLKYFTDIYVNFYQQNGSYVVEDLFFNLKNGLLHEIEVYNQGFYTISVDQELESHEDGWARTTILVIRKYTENFKYQYEFVDGILDYDDSAALLKSHLIPGKYLIYSKVQSTLQKKFFPKNPHLIIYSQNNVKLIPTSQQHHHQFLKKTFLNYGKQHKRQLYNDDLMWMSWKLINQGGFAYIAFGNDKDSKQKFVITFNEQDFADKGFKLKKPFKKQGANQILQILPGHQQIILARVINSKNRNLKFPPKLGVNIHPHVLSQQSSSLPSLPSPGQNSISKQQVNLNSREVS